MVKQDIIDMLNEHRITELLYYYFIDKGGSAIPMKDFAKILNHYMVLSNMTVEGMLEVIRKEYKLALITEDDKLIKTI